jgi:hypothetical protein
MCRITAMSDRHPPTLVSFVKSGQPAVPIGCFGSIPLHTVHNMCVASMMEKNIVTWLAGEFRAILHREDHALGSFILCTKKR